MGSEPETGEMARALTRSVPALLACEAALPTRDALSTEHDCIAAASARGHFHPDEEEVVLLRYTQYLAVRSALIQVLADLRHHVGRTATGWRNWPHRLPVFVTAYATGCLLHRAAGHLVGLASRHPVVWKKLDEPNLAAGLPRRSFSRIHREFSRAANLTRLLVAREFYRRHESQVRALAADPLVGPVVALLEREEPRMDLGKRGALRRTAAYRWFSLLRRHRAAWKRVTFGIFEAGGRAVADLRVPGIKPRGAPKRIHAGIQRQLLGLLQPGDVLVTRHDDALSNLFLPGYWPHAALFIGEPAGLERLTAEQWSAERPGRVSGPCFLEAKKDGVRVRPAAETFAVDELLVLRPPLDASARQQVVARALEHAGKPYDFLFDFRTADRLVCTEVVYRAYHGTGPVRFELREVGGRLCLPAEAFLDQSMECGFTLVATAGLRQAGTPGKKAGPTPGTEGGGVLEGQAAMEAFRRVPRPVANPA